jgi:acrylyl-CoA reductase (NADPH)
VLAPEHAGLPPESELLVTGAGGGVGGIAITLLAGLGHNVAASTGRAELHDYLSSLGAASIVAREELAQPSKPLESARWDGAIDTVGSQTLASVLARTRYRGAVAACGRAGGTDLPTSVAPFILRGVSLLGIDSVMCPAQLRAAAWSRLERDLSAQRLDAMTTVEPLSRVPELAEEILAGRIRGRVVIETGG